MSVRTWTLLQKRARAESKWIKHEKLCPKCHEARSDAGRCDKGNRLIAGYIQHQIDLERAEAQSLGVSLVQYLAGGVR